MDGDGGSVTFTADGNIDLDNSTIRYDSTGMGATLSLTTFNGTIEIGDSLLESDFIMLG